MVIKKAVIVAQFIEEPRNLLRNIENVLRGVGHTVKTPVADDDSFLVVIDLFDPFPNKQSFKERTGFIVVDCINSPGLQSLTETFIYG